MRNNNINVFNLLILSISLSACNDASKNVDTNLFTLSTGVKIVDEVQQCDVSHNTKEPILKRLDDKSYMLSISNYFSCDGEEEAYITLERAGKSSLVFHNPKGYTCECYKSLTVHIDSKRLEVGQILYIVYNSEVINHLIVP